MADASPVPAVSPPAIGDALSAGWNAFRNNTKVLLQAFGIFLGSVVALNILVLIVGGALGPLLRILLSVMCALPTVLLLPGLYAISLSAVRGRKPDLRDITIMFKSGFIHHVGLLLLQICGILACGIGVFVTQAMFIPGSFMVLDRKMDWDGAMDICVKSIKPNLLKWIAFHVVVSLVAFAGVFGLLIGVLFTGPIALCAWAYAYEKAFGGR
jgi:hypothetical protein